MHILFPPQTYTYHIKPLRDSSATDRPMTLLSLTPGNTANAAHPNGSRSAAAGGALDTGAAQALAEQVGLELEAVCRS